PLAPGKLLINPERVRKVPEVLKRWDVFHAPKPNMPAEHTLYLSSKWINMNVLMLGEQRVVVERDHAPMIAHFKQCAFKPILCGFRTFSSVGGSSHCATLAVRRRGTLQSYL